MEFPANRFSGLIPAAFGAVVNSSCPFLGIIGRFSPVTGAASAAAILIVTVALPGFMYLKKNKNKLPCEPHNVTSELTDAAPTFDPILNARCTKIRRSNRFRRRRKHTLRQALVALISWLKPMIYSENELPQGTRIVFLDIWAKFCGTLIAFHPSELHISAVSEFVGGHISELDIHLDAEYAEKLQLHEALVASLYTGQTSNYASLSAQGLACEIEMLKLEKQGEIQINNFCEICLDNKEWWEMFKNDGCSHSFCYECTSKHIMARISEKAKVIGCPGVSCGAAFDVNACKFMIPEEAWIQWDELVCQSMILDSQKLYCPFRDCSALLVNDSEASIERIRCPLCKRSFCAACRVPWHSEFTCKEFQKLNAKKGGKEEEMVKILAKKKNWQKCPSCKVFVEKTEGCIHMTCRCEYEFCYRCGAKWTGSHACRKK